MAHQRDRRPAGPQWCRGRHGGRGILVPGVEVVFPHQGGHGIFGRRQRGIEYGRAFPASRGAPQEPKRRSWQPPVGTLQTRPADGELPAAVRDAAAGLRGGQPQGSDDERSAAVVPSASSARRPSSPSAGCASARPAASSATSAASVNPLAAQPPP